MTVPALIATNAIPRYLDALRRAGIPDKVDSGYLKSLGFKSTNDQALVPLFKALGFLDSTGKPTDTYRDYRAADAKNARQILGTAIKSCYPGLFSVYPDAHRKDDEALTNWMRANTDKGEATQSRALKTFKVLRDSASFDETAPVAPSDPSPKSYVGSTTANDSNHASHRVAHSPDVTINITLQIAATNDASIYDKFFAAMKTHLFPDES